MSSYAFSFGIICPDQLVGHLPYYQFVCVLGTSKNDLEAAQNKTKNH